MPQTTKQLLLETRYPKLAEQVQFMLGAGYSWRDIAKAASTLTGVPVTHETMRAWYGKSSTTAA